ncbi:InlB B-repeat-containing protein [Eubacterium sp.]|uniref:InlB B-repeat-containing protein n=1 Tax=Eubacterium sp. TaxID=142586 RepID=UPI002FC6B42A
MVCKSSRIKWRIVFTLMLTLAMLSVSYSWLNVAQAEEVKESVPTETESFLTEEQYAALDMGNRTDPDAFSAEDTSEALNGYQPSILSELNVSIGNKKKLKDNSKTKDDNGLNVNNMPQLAESTVLDGKRIIAQNSTAIKFKDTSDVTNIVDGGIVNTYLFSENNTSMQCVQLQVFNDDNNAWQTVYEEKIPISKPGKDWVSTLLPGETAGFVAVASGDFNHNNIAEAVVYTPDMSGHFDTPISNSDMYPGLLHYEVVDNDGSYTLKKLNSYTLAQTVMSIDYDFGKTIGYADVGKKLPTVSLCATDMSGVDELVVNASLPYSSSSRYYKPDAMVIYSYNQDNYLDVSHSLAITNTHMTYDSGRYKNSAAVSADINCDGSEEIIVTGNKLTGGTASSKGKISTTENLINVVLWDEEKQEYYFAWEEPASMRANDVVYVNRELSEPQALSAVSVKDDGTQAIFCEGVYYHFLEGAGGTGNERIQNGKFSSSALEDYIFANYAGYPDNVNVDLKARMEKEVEWCKPYISKAVSGTFSSDNKVVEENYIVVGSFYEYGFYSRNPETYMIGMAVSYSDDNGVLQWNRQNNQMVGEIVKGQNLGVRASEFEDLTINAVNTDNDSTVIKYTGKTVGWSNPSVHAILLATPYWNELNYGSYGVGEFKETYGTDSSQRTDWNLGGSFSFSTSSSASCFGNGVGVGFSHNIAAGLVGNKVKGESTSSTYTYKAGPGKDYAAIVVTPIVTYNYDMYIPEHIATQEDVDNFVGEGTLNVGDIVPAETIKTATSVQMTPTRSCIPLEQYNDVAQEHNQSVENPIQELPVYDVNEIYAGVRVGDPSSYADTVNHISSADTSKDTTKVADGECAIGLTDGGSTSVSMSETSKESLTNGFKVSQKSSLDFGWKCGVDVVGAAKVEKSTKLAFGVDMGAGSSWTTGTSNGISYGAGFSPLPSSAQTGIKNGKPTSDYAFSTKMAKWNIGSSKDEELELPNGDKVSDEVVVVGYLTNVDPEYIPKALPRDLRVSATTTDTAVLNWTNPTERKPGAYKVYVSTSSSLENAQPAQIDGKDLIVDGTGTVGSCTVSGLKPKTTYYFRLKAFPTLEDAQSNSVGSVVGPSAQGTTKSPSNYPIITQPVKDVYNSVGSVPEDFEVQAESFDPEGVLSYQWQKLTLNNYGASWSNIYGATNANYNALSSYTDQTITEDNKKALNGTAYRCIISERKGNNDPVSVYTRAATLHIDDNRPEIQLELKVGEENTQLMANDQTIVIDLDTPLNAVLNISEKDTQKALPGETLVMVLSQDESLASPLQQKMEQSNNEGNLNVAFGTLPEGQYILQGMHGESDSYKSAMTDPVTVVVTPSYEISYELNGGINDYENPSSFSKEGGPILLKDPTRDGYTFKGWYRDVGLNDLVVDNTIDSAAQSSNITLYAKWEAIPYQITYELNGGNNAESNPTVYSIEDNIVFAAPTRNGFVFNGWYKEPDFKNRIDGIQKGSTGDQSVYAKWTEAEKPVIPIKPDQSGSYPVGSYQDLVEVANAVKNNPEEYANANYYLTGNIFCGGQSWDLPIGSEDHPFTGVFEGNDYIIVGLRAQSAVDKQGIFGVIGEEGQVSDLIVVDFDMAEQTEIAGGLAAVNKGTISGCSSGANFYDGGSYFDKNNNLVPLTELNSEIKAKTAGGLVGVNEGTIVDSRNNSIVAGVDYAGGIAGINHTTIENIYNVGVIQGSSYVGGLVGSNTENASLMYGYSNTLTVGLNENTAAALIGNQVASMDHLKKLYYPNNGQLAIVGHENLEVQNDGIESLNLVDMQTQAFCDTLNDNIKNETELRQWVWASGKNSDFPRIQRTILKQQTLVDSKTGVTVSGMIHPDTQLQIVKLTDEEADYRQLAQNGTIKDAYTIRLIYPDGTWSSYEGKVTIGIPTDLLSRLRSMSVGQVINGETQIQQANCGIGTVQFETSELGSVALYEKKVEDTSAGNDSSITHNEGGPETKLNKINSDSKVSTGVKGAIPWIALGIGTLACGLGIGYYIKKKHHR